MAHHDARLDGLIAHLGDGDSKDLFGRLLERGMQDLIDAELTATIGAELHERTDARTTSATVAGPSAVGRGVSRRVRRVPHADVNGQRICYEDTGGVGPPIVLAHGFLMDRSMFDPQIEVLTPIYRVVTWDQRGFGQTEFDDQPFTYWDSAQDLLGLMDHLGIERAVVGGMSQGGFVSLRAALLAPQRVRALILLDSAATAQRPDVAAQEQQMAATWLEHGPVDELTNAVADLIVADPVEGQRWISKWKARPKELMRHPSVCLFGRDDLSDRLGEITCPALVVHGVDDHALPMEEAHHLAEGLPGAGSVVEVPGAHAANLTHPGPVNDALLRFLEDLSTL